MGTKAPRWRSDQRLSSADDCRPKLDRTARGPQSTIRTGRQTILRSFPERYTHLGLNNPPGRFQKSKGYPNFPASRRRNQECEDVTRPPGELGRASVDGGGGMGYRAVPDSGKPAA